jgi:hypothetical protein
MRNKITELTERMLDGVVEDMLSEKFYPSLQCKTFNRVCDYMPLCFEVNPNIDELYIKGGETNGDAIAQSEEPATE